MFEYLSGEDELKLLWRALRYPLAFLSKALTKGLPLFGIVSVFPSHLFDAIRVKEVEENSNILIM